MRAPMRVLLAGALSNTGQLVARSLTSDYSVAAMCTPNKGAAISDDTGPLAATKVSPSGNNVLVDALVIATDDPPPAASLSRLLKQCKCEHTVLLSRIGGSTGSGGLSAWKEAEEAAAECCPSSLTIVRLGEPLLGGPYHANDIDQIAWKKASVADQTLAATVAKGDQLSQSGFGSSRVVAASAIASVLRRGPEKQASYSVVSQDGEATTSVQYDAMFSKAAGTTPTFEWSDESARVSFDLSDEELKPFTEPYVPPPLSPLEALKAAFFGNPAAAGPNWAILIFFVGGMYQCTTPDYIARTGVDVFGLAPGYGITLARAGYGSLDSLPSLSGVLGGLGGS